MNLIDLKGVGPSVLKKLERLSILTIENLLYHFPSRYIDRRKNLKVFDLKLIENENYHCIATIKKIKRVRLRGGMDMTTALFEDDTGFINVTWFNNPYITSQYKEGDEIIFSGSINKSKVSNPKLKLLNSENREEIITSFAKIEPIYPETRGLRSYQLHFFVKDALQKVSNLKETLPKKVLKSEKLLERTEAINKIHFPLNETDIISARERLGFEEIFNIIKEVNKRKKLIKKYPATKISIKESYLQNLKKKVSFEFTNSQELATKEIYSDLAKEHPMHRLLNGDVGSGKTIVAAAAAAQVLENNLQVIILAPTGVLARQHYESFRELFEDLDISVHLITSSTRRETLKLKKKKEERKKEGEVFIGTHALLYHQELFQNIGLVVIDEQHKFGVKQRELLENLRIGELENVRIKESGSLKKNNSQIPKFPDLQINSVPHVLSMSATPIPRSLALTLFGDIEVSILEKPVSRKKIITKIIYDEDLSKRMYEWIRQQIRENKEQVYVVCPLIEESEKLDAKAAVLEFENLKKLYPEFKIELLHGKLKQKDKDEILTKFKNKEFDILVSTSVIEVGIDNPNASIMIIEGAERFGLAQLHQIRGRVGRSEKQSYCFLRPTVSSFDDRLEYFASSEDGFRIAEYDLKRRGPGEVYGEAQSGLPDLKIANILDIDLIKRVKKYFI